MGWREVGEGVIFSFLFPKISCCLDKVFDRHFCPRGSFMCIRKKKEQEAEMDAVSEPSCVSVCLCETVSVRFQFKTELSYFLKNE